MQHIEPISFEPLNTQTPKTKKGPPLTKISLVIALILLTIVAWFIFNAKSIAINVEPGSAEVSIDSWFKFVLADRILLQKGNYKIEIHAEGYQPLSDSIALGSEQNQQFNYRLKLLPGHLEVDVAAIDSATVSLDGINQGIAPLTIRNIEAGEHQLTINAERYFPLQQAVEIEGRNTTQSLTLDLTPAWANIELTSQPDGAQISVDDKEIRLTSATIELLQGKHDIRIKKSGFKVWQKTINVVASEHMTFTDINLAPADATLFISSNPAGASVTINNSYRGITPLELAVEANTPASIHLRKQGYQAKKSTASVGSGETKRLNLTMSPDLVAVVFNIKPADAKLYINGKLTKLTANKLSLPTKKQTIEVRKKGFVDFRTSITPHTGAIQQVRVKLKTLQQQKLENIKSIITTPAGQKLKLFYPYAFTMGASRREPGRRANEALQEVELKRPFYLSFNEVTNEEFRLFKDTHSSGSIQGNSLNSAKQPVVNVSWQEAALYSNWLSNKESLKPFYQTAAGKITGINPATDGYRLPSEAEWAWAARTLNKNKTLKLPWGSNTLPPNKGSGNYADRSSANFLGKTINDYNDGFATSSPIGSFPANHKGLFDIGGNVAEWVNDYYSARSGAARVLTDPLGPEKGEFHVVRGASWAHGTITELRLSFRDYTDKARDDVGFRIARYLE